MLGNISVLLELVLTSPQFETSEMNLVLPLNIISIMGLK